ncbi:MAG: ABC transporter permease [Candidatus Bipolaricaulota bacterium]|nr:ABC transporter permease [Candidatus Bipolaricaulota bacterium]
MRRFISRNKGFSIGSLMVIIVIIMAVFAPLIAPHGYAEADLMDALEPPGGEHLLGTDQFGRDLLSRIIYGARLSLMIGIFAQAINLIIGVTLGLAAGYLGGKLDDAIMGLTNVMLSMPVLILAMAVMTLLGPGLVNLFIALGLTNWTYGCRIARSETLSLKEEDFVSAARAIGCSTFRILRRHILSNCLGPILVIATLGVADAILIGAALGFLGLGAQPPQSEWGTMLSHGRDYLRLAPWICTFPGLALVFTILGFNLLGDGLRDFTDPYLRTRK